MSLFRRQPNPNSVQREPGSPEAPRRSARQLIVDPVFGSDIAGKVVSTGGLWIHNVVSAMLVFELTGSAFVVGLTSVAQFGSQLLASPASGALVDRGDRKVQAVVGRLSACFRDEEVAGSPITSTHRIPVATPGLC